MKYAKAICLFVLTAVAAGCVQPVKVHRYPLFADKEITLSEAGEAIRTGGEQRGWKMTPVADDQFYATYRFGKRAIMVDVSFNTEEFLIKYKDSVNLKYDGNSIHRRYNQEVGFLASSIQSVSRFLVPAARRSDKGQSGSGTEEGPKASSTGTGFVISAKNQILTNFHVVDECSEIYADSARVNLVASDQINDLALLQANNYETFGKGPAAGSHAVFRAGPRLRKGEEVVVAGYPLDGILSSEMKLTTGSVNALTGLADDSRAIQISAQVQPGNSGGPVFDHSGHVVGVVSARISDLYVAVITGGLPQNVNFAIKLAIVQSFLESEGLTVEEKQSDETRPVVEIAEQAQGFTVRVRCRK